MARRSFSTEGLKTILWAVTFRQAPLHLIERNWHLAPSFSDNGEIMNILQELLVSPQRENHAGLLAVGVNYELLPNNGCAHAFPPSLAPIVESTAVHIV